MTSTLYFIDIEVGTPPSPTELLSSRFPLPCFPTRQRNWMMKFSRLWRRLQVGQSLNLELAGFEHSVSQITLEGLLYLAAGCLKISIGFISYSRHPWTSIGVTSSTLLLPTQQFITLKGKAMYNRRQRRIGPGKVYEMGEKCLGIWKIGGGGR